MNNKKNLQKVAGVLVSSALFLGLMTTAFAQTSVSTTLSATIAGGTTSSKGKGMNIAAAISRASTAIDTRVTDLNALEQRISEMQNVDAATKASLSASLQNEISDLTTLKTKISGDTTAATVRTDVKDITAGNRVFMLVEPQARILAAADRVTTIVGMMNALVPKLQTRIADATTAGKDVTALGLALADLQSRVADATTQGMNASSSVTGLVPDNGNATIMASNTAALKAARADLQTANKDLTDASKDAKTIIAGVKGIGVDASANANVSASASTSTTTTTTQ